MNGAQMSGTDVDVHYKDLDTLWQGYDESVRTLAEREGVKAVAELGGGAIGFGHMVDGGLGAGDQGVALGCVEGAQGA